MEMEEETLQQIPEIKRIIRGYYKQLYTMELHTLKWIHS